MSRLMADTADICYKDCYLPSESDMMCCLGCFKRFHYVCNPSYNLETSDTFTCRDCDPFIGNIPSSQPMGDSAPPAPTSVDNIENVLCMDILNNDPPNSDHPADKSSQTKETQSSSSSQTSQQSTHSNRQPLASRTQSMDRPSPILVACDAGNPTPGTSGLGNRREPPQTARKSTATPTTSTRTNLIRRKSPGGIIIPVVSSSSSSEDDGETEIDVGANEEQDEDTEYEVGDIISHGTRGGKIHFQVTWKGYPNSEKSWLSEEALANCRSKVVAYRRKKKLGPTTIPRPAAGYVPTTNLPKNTANWVEYEEILKIIKGYDIHKFSEKIQVNLYEDKLEKRDLIYIIPIGTHATTGLYIARTNTMYIGDGANEVLQSEEYLKQAKELIDATIKPIKVIGQRAVDHCATSSALIALVFMRLYVKKHSIPSEITLPKSTQNYMVKTYHKEDSVPITGWKPIGENLIKDTCPNCSKVFRSQRNAYINHMRFCKPKHQ